MTPNLPTFHAGAPSGPVDVPKRMSRWMLWGCMGAIVIAVFLCLGLLLSFLGTKPGRTTLTWANDVAACQGERLPELAGALERYHMDKGKLPNRLEDLVPTYARDKKILRCPADRGRKSGTSFRYRPWVAWGEGRGVVVYCPNHPVPGALGGPEGPNKGKGLTPVILQDGTVDLQRITASTLIAEDAKAGKETK